MKWTCRATRKEYVSNKHNAFTLGNLEGRDHFQGSDVDGLQHKSDLKNVILKMPPGLFGSELGTIMRL
jgi:hypothetical protein